MRLSDLVSALESADASVPLSVEVTGVAYDSRRVQPGNLFVAIGGFHVDGARFVSDAILRGAVAAVVSTATDIGVTESPAVRGKLIHVPDTRRALADLAAEWFGCPAERLYTIGITGTDGKTSTSYLTSAVLEAAALKTGLFSTVAYKVGSQWEPNKSRQTTPEALEVQALLRRMLDAGVTHAVLESTSHGLALHKLDHCEYDVAVFTNLSPDHLDFHESVQRYRAAKGLLFEMLDGAKAKGVVKTAVLNADDPSTPYMASRTLARKLFFGIDSAADVMAVDVDERPSGTQMVLAAPTGRIDLFLPLPGRFNVYNALAAASVGVSLDLPLGTIASGLSRATGVPGRMQPVDAGQPFTVIADSAHTAASFEKVLATLRPLVKGRLIAVFGCAGERGVERRTGMGRVAARNADYTVITTEDPRGEDPDAIIDQIAGAMGEHGAEEGRDFERVIDRREAIARAFDLARAGDLVLLTGKGHEHSIETAAGRVPWDEVAVARELLNSGAMHDSGITVD